MPIAFTPTDAQNALPGFGSGSFTANIGTASSDRIVIVGYQCHTGGGMAAPTLNGTTMTLAAGNSVTADNIAIYYANVTSGTTATIAYVGGANGVGITVGILTGQSGGGSATPSNTATYTAAGAQPLSLSLTVPTGGIGVIVGGGTVGAASPTFTWTGTTAGAGDESTGNTNCLNGMAHSTATGSVTVSCSSSLSFGGTMAAASWAAGGASFLAPPNAPILQAVKRASYW